MSELVTIPDEVPFPPRYWWLKRIAFAYALLFVALLILRLWWGHVAHNRLEAEIAKYKTAGEPIEPEDFDPKVVLPDEDNAASLLMEAANALSLNDHEMQLCRKLDGDSLHWREHREEFGSLVNRARSALELVRRSRTLTKVDWGIRFRTPVSATMLPHLAPARWLAAVASAAVYALHEEQRDGEAIEGLLDILHLSRCLDQDPGGYSHLSAGRIAETAGRTLEGIFADLRVGRSFHRSIGSNPIADEVQLRVLMECFLDDSRARNAMVERMWLRRAMALDVGRQLTGGCPPSQVINTTSVLVIPRPIALLKTLSAPIVPMYELDTLRSFRFIARQIEASAQNDYPAAFRMEPSGADLPAPTSPLAFARPVNAFLGTIPEPGFPAHFRVLAIRRMAAIALAIRLYEIDYDETPLRLRELIPEFLPQMPSDPFSPDSSEFHFRYDHENTLLYSVGRDGVDDEGRETVLSRDRYTVSRGDIVFYLDRSRVGRDPASSPEAANDQSNIHDTERETDDGEPGDDEPESRDSDPDDRRP